MLHPTFKATCVAHGLLEDDGEWKKWVEEAGDMQTGQQLCSLFVTILLHCHPSLPHVLWNQFRVKICDELNHRLTAQGHLDPTEEDTFDYGLNLIHVLMQSGKTLKHYHDMPFPGMTWSLTLYFKSSSLLTRRKCQRGSIKIILTLALSRSLPLTKLLILPRTIRERFFYFTVLEVVERPMSVI